MLCEFCLFLCTQQHLTLCTRDPLTGELWPAPQRWVDLLDEFQGVRRRQFEAEASPVLAGVPCELSSP